MRPKNLPWMDDRLPLAGKPIIFQRREFNRLAQAGLWDERQMVERIRRKEFPPGAVLRSAGQRENPLRTLVAAHPRCGVREL